MYHILCLVVNVYASINLVNILQIDKNLIKIYYYFIKIFR